MDSHIDMQDPSQYSPSQKQANSPPSPVNDTGAIIKAQKKVRSIELRAISRTFGNIASVPIFTVWDKRQDCSDSAVHRSLMAGICGDSKIGAFSIALSSLYKDDEDRGDVIIYTGTGGRERWSNAFPPKRLRLGPQTKDQSWDHPSNKALMISCETGNPGYRYDGLYKVISCWSARGRNGKKICRCRLERLPDQPPIPERQLTLSTSRRRRRERLVSSRDISDVTIHQQSSARQEVVPDAAENDFGINEADLDVKEDLQPLPPQARATFNPDVLPRYRWDAITKQLVKVTDSHPNPEVERGDEEGHRGEDDAATLVPSEDGHTDMVVERAATEYFSDGGNSPRFQTPDEPRPSGS